MVILNNRASYRGYRALGAVAVAVFVAVSFTATSARQGDAARIDNDDIGGTVSGPRGPEAGVWVIAETRDLPTGFRRIVVTDDRGRYVLPDLPRANYDVWVRGYGLVDSRKVQAALGKVVNLTAVPAPDARSAAQYYPANYWFSLLQIPAKSEFPGTGPTGNGIAANIKSQGEYLRTFKTDGCWACHQLGNKATRDSERARDVRLIGGRVGAARAVGPGGGEYAGRSQQPRPAARAGDACRLDRSHCCGGAPAAATASARHRT